MTPELLEELRSIADVEDEHPYFRTKNYVIVDNEEEKIDLSADAVPVVLRHPDQVIIVTPHSYRNRGQKFPPFKRQSTKLSVAVWQAMSFMYEGHPGASVVVYEGLYIDPTAFLRNNRMSHLFRNFSLEIVGMGDVRILNLLDIRECFFSTAFSELTVKNVAIYHRPSLKEPNIDALDHDVIMAMDARLTLKDVRMHGTGYVLRCFNAEVDILDCMFLECGGIKTAHNTKIRAERCRWTGTERGIACCIQVDTDCSLDMKSSFISGMFAVSIHGEAKFEKCQITLNSTLGMWANCGGRLSMQSCRISKAGYAVLVSDSHSKAALRNCLVDDCDTAVVSMVNSAVSH